MKGFTLFKQPIYNSFHSLVGYELLLRHKSNNRDIESLIRMLEENGHIPQIDVSIMTMALRRILVFGLSDVFYNVNISALTLENDEAISKIIRCYNRYKDRLSIRNISLRFEITETARINKMESAIENITRLRNSGIPLIIDDFGSGNNTIILLGLVKPKAIKFSKEFADSIKHEGVRELVKVISDHAKTNDISIVGEGIETIEQLNSMKDLGIDLFQGYYLGKPEGFENVN